MIVLQVERWSPEQFGVEHPCAVGERCRLRPPLTPSLGYALASSTGGGMTARGCAWETAVMLRERIWPIPECAFRSRVVPLHRNITGHGVVGRAFRILRKPGTASCHVPACSYDWPSLRAYSDQAFSEKGAGHPLAACNRRGKG